VFNRRVPRVESRDLRAKLVAAAVEMLEAPQAIAVPSLRSIARACQVAPSAVYWHFPSDSELRVAILDAEYADLAATVERSLAKARKGSNRLVLAWQAYAAWGLAHPGGYQLLFESSDRLAATRADDDPRPPDRFVELAATFDPAAPLTSARLMWSAVHGIVSLRLHKTDVDWKISLDTAVSHVVAALSAEPPRAKRKPAS